MSTTPSPATCQSEFEQAVAYALHLWPALTLSVQNNWGGADSSDKRDWFAGAIVDLFPDISKLPASSLQQLQQQQPESTTPQQPTSTSSSSSKPTSTTSQPPLPTDEPDQADVESVLLQVMLDEFEVAVDDDSAYEVAEQIIRARSECLRGKLADGEVAALRRRWSAKKPGEKIEFKMVESKSDDEGTDWDTDEEEEDGEGSDVEMGEAPQLVERKEKEKKEPEVDEDGFTTVVSRKKK